MVALSVICTFALAIAVDALVVKKLADRRIKHLAGRHDRQPATTVIENPHTLYHSGHTWVKVRRALVEVGLDDFTRSLVGQITGIETPQAGEKVNKGAKAWTIRFGKRSLTQLAPISGTVFEVNQNVVNDPSLLSQKTDKDGWIFRMVPDALSQELPDLYTPIRFSKWIDLQKAQLVKESFPELGLVYGDGERLVSGAALQLDEDKWEIVARKLFGRQNNC